MKHTIPVHAPKHRSATLANSSSATIHGQTTPQVVKIQQFSAPVVFQVLDTLDGIDVVLGMNFLSAHSISILPKSRSVSISMHDGSCLVVKSAPQASAFTQFSTDTLEVVSGARLARLVANEDCDVLLGYMKELTTIDHTSTAATAPSGSQPTEFAAFEQDILREFSDVLHDDVPPRLPPERTLPDGRKIGHAIPLKSDAKPVAQPPYKLSPAELDEVHRTLTRLTQQGWIRPSLSPWGSPLLFQRKKSGKLRMCNDYRALNHATAKYAYPMPVIDELLEKLQGYKVVSKLDLSEGFHHIRVAPQDVYKTA
jgi:hypothetical protein